MNRQIQSAMEEVGTVWRRPRADVQQRLRSLSMMASYLAALRSVDDVWSEVRAGLEECFGRRVNVEIYLHEQGWRKLVPVFDPHTGDGRLRRFCLDLETIPRDRRALELVPDLVPYLVVANSIPGDTVSEPRLSAPMLVGNTLLGLIVVEAPLRAPDFTESDVDLVAAIAKQVAVAYQTVLSKARQSHRPLLAQDLDLARKIQRSFLPALAPRVNGFRVAAEYRPAFDVGGDFYDVVSSAPGQVTAVIGDVSGKGVSAALVMSRLSSEFRRAANAGLGPSEILAQLNGSLAMLSLDDTFATAAIVRLDAVSAELTVANAGHVPPLVRSLNGAVQMLGGSSGLPLGMLASESYGDEKTPMANGDIVLLMTDGVVDPFMNDADPIGMGSLHRLLAESPPDVDEVSRTIFDAIERSAMGGHGDDAALLVLEIQDNVRRLAA